MKLPLEVYAMIIHYVDIPTLTSQVRFANKVFYKLVTNSTVLHTYVVQALVQTLDHSTKPHTTEAKLILLASVLQRKLNVPWKLASKLWQTFFPLCMTSPEYINYEDVLRMAIKHQLVLFVAPNRLEHPVKHVVSTTMGFKDIDLELAAVYCTSIGNNSALSHVLGLVPGHNRRNVVWKCLVVAAAQNKLFLMVRLIEEVRGLPPQFPQDSMTWFGEFPFDLNLHRDAKECTRLLTRLRKFHGDWWFTLLQLCAILGHVDIMQVILCRNVTVLGRNNLCRLRWEALEYHHVNVLLYLTNKYPDVHYNTEEVLGDLSTSLLLRVNLDTCDKAKATECFVWLLSQGGFDQPGIKAGVFRRVLLAVDFDEPVIWKLLEQVNALPDVVHAKPEKRNLSKETIPAKHERDAIRHYIRCNNNAIC
ncbi:hypothetical protein BDR26DRAFT_942301 [Obelidium mucronatum]|nr:hypothetical protein BDR26DRAFT_942301 [Obelidium mucronatum]